MTMAWLLVVVGIVGLVWSADRFVAGSAALARNLGVSKMVIGLTVVSLGTSAPEIIVSLDASIRGIGALAIGNALGSNIANIGLVLSLTALIAAIPIQRHLLSQEIPTLLAITAIAGIFLWDGQLKRWEGVVLLMITVPLLYIMYRVKRQHPEELADAEDIPDLSMILAVVWFVVGLVVLVISARLLVTGAETIAKSLGVSELVIGLTVVAIGTSLPELAASVMSAIKGHHDIALGNIIGSNIFNILTVMAVPGLVGMDVLEHKVFYRDYVATAVITALLCLAIVGQFYGRRFLGAGSNNGQARLGRGIGLFLLLCYMGYSAILFYSESSPPG
jgi:cation:H+ antiporter